jgi:drug/metabolite transporter (DMT)-like permease
VSSGAPVSANAIRGIGLKVASVAIFVGMSSFIKAAGPLPAGQVVFFRSFFAMLPIIVYLAWRRDFAVAVRTSRPLGHLARGLVGVTSMCLGFYGLARLPLPESITINYAQPLLVVAFSALFLGESVRLYRWTAVTVGLIGVLIVSWPKLTLVVNPELMNRAESLGVLATLVGAGFSACAMLLVRSLVHSERSETIVMWFSMTATGFSLLTIPFGWEWLAAPQVACLVAAGICGGVAQLLMTEAYRHAEASVVAPFEYTSLILGLAVGFVLFGDVPTIHMLVGGAIVVGAGIFIILRERQLGLARGAARKLSPPQ